MSLFPKTIRIGSVAVTIMATENGIFVKCADSANQEKTTQWPVRNLDEAYQVASTEFNERLKAQVEAEVSRVIEDHRGRND